MAAATGGTFVAATNQDEFKQGLATVLDAASGADAAQPEVAGEAADQDAESGGDDDAAAPAVPAPNAGDAPVPSRVRTIDIPPPVIEPQATGGKFGRGEIAATSRAAASSERPRPQ